MMLFNHHWRNIMCQPTRVSKPDFINCHRDLKNLYNDAMQIDLSQTLTGYSFVELFEKLDAEVDFISSLKKTELLIIVHQTPEFDAEYSHVGAYLSDRYQYLGDVVDVSDQGIFCFFSAINIAQEYFLNGCAHNACILAFEQSNILTYDKQVKSIPKNNAIGYLFLTLPRQCASSLEAI